MGEVKMTDLKRAGRNPESKIWPRSDLLDLLGITHPIIQAPMAGFGGPALVGAVSNAGALGSIGCGATPNQTVRDQILEIRRATDRPFNLNFFPHAAPPHIDPDATRRMQERLSAYYREFDLGAVPEPSDPLPVFDEERLQLLLDLKPPIVSFHFGVPSTEKLKRIKLAGIIVLCSATTVAEARKLEADGVDAIIAQGYDAGGHRGTFSAGDGAGLIGTMALVPQIVDAVSVPVIAAGGIADGRGIAAAFALGASGVQLGTAFLGCPEATVSNVYRDTLRRAADEDTRLTRIFTGRPARVLRNRLTDELGDEEPLEFPAQLSLLWPLIQNSSASADTPFLPLWAGQGAPLTRDLPAAKLIEALVMESRERLAGG
jgi:nitronate monooxygenase